VPGDKKKQNKFFTGILFYFILYKLMGSVKVHLSMLWKRRSCYHLPPKLRTQGNDTMPTKATSPYHPPQV